MTKHRMRRALAAPLALSLALAACSDSTGPAGGFATDEMAAALAVTPDHFHTLETTGTFTVAVTDPDGEPVTDFELLRLERRRAGAADWSALELARQGDVFVGTYVFEVSGDYQLRVTGIRPSDDELVVLYEADAPLSVVRAHAEVGGRRLELENVPGHIHAGEESAVTFWVTEPQRNAEGVRPPVTGLTPTIWVETGGTRTPYAAQETAPGVYAATHLFATVGTPTVGITVLGTDGQQHEWSVPIRVHAPH